MFLLTDIKLIVVFIIFTIFGYFLYSLKKKYEFWKDRGVPQAGFTQDFLLSFRKHRYYILQDIYNKFASLPYVGFYTGSKPYLMILDLNLIRKVFITDFSHFTDHTTIVNLDHDPLNASHILNQTGQRWKNTRTKLSPIFSSGKLRRMSILMNECTKILDKHLEQTLLKSDEIETRDLMQKFGIDVIGICAFGLNCQAIEDENSEFKRITRRMTLLGTYIRIFVMLITNSVCPTLASWLKLKATDPQVEDFFYSLMRDTAKNREKTEMKRDDFLQLLVNLRAEEQKMLQSQNDGSEPLFTDDVCTANVLIFFLAGFDPVSNTLSHCLYDLALHPDIMEKLHTEIIQVKKSHNGEVNYDVLKKMHFMDCVVNETLRLHTTAGWIERICTKTYQIPDSSLVIEKNTSLLVPTQCIHLDPRYFPNPQKYDPERFNEENKPNIIPGSYFPFGDGPRICIAQRFALMEIKAALALIIGKYSVHPCAKTQIPLKINPRSFNISPHSIHLKFKKRKN